MQQKRRVTVAEPACYRVQVQGRLPDAWSAYFADLAVQVEGEDGWAVTTLAGKLADQAALLGLLQQLNTLGLPLLSVELEA